MSQSKYVPIILFLMTLFLFPAGVRADVHLTSDRAVPGAPFAALQAQIDTLMTMNTDLQAQIDAQATAISALQAEQVVQNGNIATNAGDISTFGFNLSTLQAQVDALPDVSGLFDIFAGVSRIAVDHDNDLITPDVDTIRFEGVNLQIVNGLGETDGVPDGFNTEPGVVNGTGNLIIGYNEPRFIGGSSEKTGSHNLVLGEEHSYSSFGGLVAGFRNTISARGASVSGGAGNTASGPRASVSGGSGSTASGNISSVSGGSSNTASGDFSSVSGGPNNTASGPHSSVSGGAGNEASAFSSSVSGGDGNIASGDQSSVSGGLGHIADGPLDWRAGNLFEDF